MSSCSKNDVRKAKSSYERQRLEVSGSCSGEVGLGVANSHFQPTSNSKEENNKGSPQFQFLKSSAMTHVDGELDPSFKDFSQKLRTIEQNQWLHRASKNSKESKRSKSSS